MHSDLATQDQTDESSRGEPQQAALLILRQGGRLLVPPRLQRLRYGFAIGRGVPELTDERWQVDDVLVSRKHALIALGKAGWALTDLGSRNGSVVANRMIRGTSTPLESGTVFSVGGHVAVFLLLDNADASTIETDGGVPIGPVRTCSPALMGVATRIQLLAPTNRSILLSGETGTGKEVVARMIHDLSSRRGPFVAINCASISHELFESELFGYRRGSHSQAREDHPGLIASAAAGTLFLDEIGEMSGGAQAKLLRFLQDKQVMGLGQTNARTVDVRVIAATQNPFASLRQDIIGRFGAEPMSLPPLRDRRQDIGALCTHFLGTTTGSGMQIEAQAFLALIMHAWPRNVRELEAVVSEASLRAESRSAREIALDDLTLELRETFRALRAPAQPAGADRSVPASTENEAKPPRRARPSRDELERLLRECAGDVPAIARRLERHRELVWRWCREAALDPAAFR
ncbi:MAG TPA: sigma 54-interacting transcriptional regulator [Polyangia bacterium]